jgi:hypothetical protein
MKKLMAFKCAACAHEEQVSLPPWLRGATHKCSNCATGSKLRSRMFPVVLLGLIGPAIAWAAYMLGHPLLPPYMALFIASAIVTFPVIAFRSKLIEWTTLWAIDSPK